MDTSADIPVYFFPINATRGDESSVSLLAKWAKLATLSDAGRDKLTSQRVAEIIQGISSTFNFNQQQASTVAIVVRRYYFNELRLEDLPSVLAREIPVEFSRAKEITRLILEKIINDRSQEVASQAQQDSLLLSEALQAYPELGEQLITSEKISLKNFPEPVRPSLKNWLADYTFTVGYDNKDTIKRGNYIFHGNNTLHLSAIDRQKLAYVLKAHDDNSELTINKNLKQIVFPAFHSEPATIARPQEETPAIKSYAAPISYQPIQPVAPRPTPQPQHIKPIPAPEPKAQTQLFQSANLHQNSFFSNSNQRPQAAPLNQNRIEQKPPAAKISYSSAQKLPYEKISSARSEELHAQQILQETPLKKPALQQSANVSRLSRMSPPASRDTQATSFNNPAIQKNAMPQNNISTQNSNFAPTATPRPHSFTIKPIFSKSQAKDETRSLPKNVVNLKDM
jgi:hypothetical protein